MRNLLLVVGLAGVVAGAAACGDSKRNPVAQGGGASAGKGSLAPSAGKSANNEGGAGGEGGNASVPADPLDPIVTITAPVEVTDPNEEGVLSGTEVEVVCTAKPGTDPEAEDIDGTSVKLQLLDGDGMLVEEKTGSPTANDDEYRSTFVLTDVPAGALGFRCTAIDRGMRSGDDEIATLFDKGPIITFITPEADGFQALGETLAIDFTVEPASLGDDDEGAVVESVELQVGGVDFSDELVGPGSYHVEVNLQDATLFTPPPNGPLPLRVTATNRRTPSGVTAVKTQSVAIDGDGPTIRITYPVDKQVVGGKVPLSFEVADDVAGADPESVVVTLNDVPYSFSENDPDWGRTPTNVFTFEFDTRLITGSKVQITVNISAKDEVGNAAAIDASALLYLDNFPPSVDLDPLNVRGYNNNGECSTSFDPVGDLALNDQTNVGAAGTLRALVWDNTNFVEGVPVRYHSGTDPAKVRLYLQPNDGLLVDTDEDGVCDDVLDPDSTASFALDPVTPNNNPWWGHDDAVAPTPASLATHSGYPVSCATRDPDPADPVKCENINSDMWQVIKHGDGSPVIYGTDVGGGTCTGSGWEFTTKLDADGWVCFAARAVDRIGNVGVSRPLRLCVDDSAVPGEPACKSGGAAPACTVSCTPPPRWGNVGVKLD